MSVTLPSTCKLGEINDDIVDITRVEKAQFVLFFKLSSESRFEKVLLSLKWRDGSPCVGKHEKGNCFWRCVMRSQTFYIPRVSETFIALRFQVEIHVSCIFSRPLTVAESLGRATIMLILKTLERNVKV